MNLDLCMHIDNQTDCINTILWQWISCCIDILKYHPSSNTGVSLYGPNTINYMTEREMLLLW